MAVILEMRSPTRGYKIIQVTIYYCVIMSGLVLHVQCSGGEYMRKMKWEVIKQQFNSINHMVKMPKILHASVS